MRDHAALIDLVESRARAPLAWGVHDCVLFAADAAQAQTGVDYRARLLAIVGRPWKSAAGAAKALAAAGGLKAATDQVLRRVARAKAHRGDIGLLVIDGVESLVVIEGDTVVGPGLDGLVRHPRSALAAAWSLDGQPLHWWTK